jgi:hypothetical protein
MDLSTFRVRHGTPRYIYYYCYYYYHHHYYASYQLLMLPRNKTAADLITPRVVPCSKYLNQLKIKFNPLDRTYWVVR